MEEECVRVIIRLLNKLLDPDTKINDDQVITLVKCLTGFPGDGIAQNIINNILVTWMTEAVSRWEKTFNSNPEVLTLAINLSVYLSSNEETFLKLECEDIFQRFIRLLKKALENMQASPNIGYVKLISSFLNHKSGCKWLMSSTYWTEVVDLTLKNPNDSGLAKEGYKFISKIIVESVSINMEFCSKVIQLMIEPIINLATALKDTETIEDVTFLFHDKDASLNLIIAVLENLCEEHNVNIYETFLTVANENKFENYLIDLKQKISNKYLCFPITTILYILHIYEIVVKAHMQPSKYVQYEVMMAIAKKLIDFKKDIANNEPISLFVKLCSYGQKCCSLLGPLAPTLITKDKTIRPYNMQMLFYQLYPCMYVSIKLTGMDNVYYDIKDVIRDRFISKACGIMLPITYRFLFLIRDNLDTNFSLTDATIALKYIMESRKYFNKEQINIAVNILILTFKDFTNAIKDEPKKLAGLSEKDSFILNLIKTITLLIKESDFNWQDILGAMSLMEMTVTTLQFESWENEVYAYGLKLISLAFEKHLSMNMTFLTDQYEEDFLQDIITLTSEKLESDCSDVRSSAVEVIGSMSQNINERFSWFVKTVIDKNLPSRVLKMGLMDKEPLVRASSLKCLQNVTKVEEFWNILNNHYDIIEELTQSLYNDPDECVRSESAILLTGIYENRELLTFDIFRLYDVMSYAVMRETHADVKIRALKFWKQITDYYLTAQGMLDGEFPDMTFSKELKKIIVLTDAEIAKRLFKVLDELSKNGCLAVLVSALQDKNEIQKAVIDIMNDFITKLKKYGVVTNSFKNKINIEKTGVANIVLEDRNIANKILGREILSSQDFLNVLNEHLIDLHNKKSISITKQIEIILNTILSNQ